MSYEYSSESRKLDLPNPFKVENLFHFLAALVMIGGAIGTLIFSRSALAAEKNVWAFVPIAVGLFLLLRGITHAKRGLEQLRFFFGRGEPKDLGVDVNIRETIRQNALEYPEPAGALNGLLYTLIPNLIFAPKPIQWIAQRQFHNVLAAMATLISFGVAMALVQDPATDAALGAFYFAFAMFLVLRPLEGGAGAQSGVGVAGLVVLILVAILGPVAIQISSVALPNLTWLHLNVQTAVLLFTTLLAEALYFVALTKQMIEPPVAASASVTRSVSFNAHPKQLFDELERELQRDWVKQIPNRSYANSAPQVNGEAGSFWGELVQETQPLPRDDVPRGGLTDSLGQPRFKWLTLLNGFGFVQSVVAVGALILFAAHADSAERFSKEAITLLTMGMSMLAVSAFSFKAAHSLWGRFDFVSDVVWVEFEGNFQRSRFGFGNQLLDRTKSDKQVIEIQTMTMRVWAASFETVSFGKGAARMVVGMAGNRDRAEYLASHLEQFAKEQSLIISPTAAVDVEKASRLGTLNQLVDASSTSQASQALSSALASPVGVALAATLERDGINEPETTKLATQENGCEKCDDEAGLGSKFCSFCGARVQAA